MRQTRGLTVLYVAFALRLVLVPLARWLPTLTLSPRVQHALMSAPLPVTALTLIGFMLLGRGDRSGDLRSAMFAQLAAALLSTELLFELILLVDPMRFANFPALRLIVEALWTLILLTSWASLRAVAAERGATPPTAWSALFYFAVAIRVGLYLERAWHARPAVDAHHIDAASAAVIIVSLVLPLLELLLTGAARRATA